MAEATEHEHKSSNINAAGPIEIVLGVYDPKGTYSVHAGVLMASIFERTQSPVRVHILHDETLTNDNREKFLRTAEKYDQRVEFHDITERIKDLGQTVLASAWFTHYSIGTLFRLLIPEMLAPTLERVIYLDCDVLVNLDIRSLWEIDMQGNCIAGVLDCSESKRNRIFSSTTLRAALIGCRLPDYVNAGVLVMDLKKIRALPVSMLSVVPSWFERHAHIAVLLDQDFLNAFFRGSILHIPNIFNERDEEHDGTGVILHMICNQKPWARVEGLPQEKLYWQAYLNSAWGENTTREELLDRLLHTASLNFHLHRHTSQCWRRIGSRLWRDVFRNDLVISIEILSKEARYWLMRLFKKK